MRSAALQAAGAALLVMLGGCASFLSRPPLAAMPVHRSPFDEPPGAIDPDVRQANVRETICTAGWTAAVLPPAAALQRLKLQMLREAGVPASQAKYYELDHLIPLALGGHPRSPDNLWLQRWHGEWGAGVKDVLERTLHRKVCRGEMDLSVARLLIQHDWKSALTKYVEDEPVDRRDGDAEPESIR